MHPHIVRHQHNPSKLGRIASLFEILNAFFLKERSHIKIKRIQLYLVPESIDNFFERTIATQNHSCLWKMVRCNSFEFVLNCFDQTEGCYIKELPTSLLMQIHHKRSYGKSFAQSHLIRQNTSSFLSVKRS